MEHSKQKSSNKFRDKWGVYPRENRADAPFLCWIDVVEPTLTGEPVSGIKDGEEPTYQRVNFGDATYKAGMELLNAVGREYQGQGALVLAWLLAAITGVGGSDYSEFSPAFNAVRLLYGNRLEIERQIKAERQRRSREGIRG
ncbi:MAG: hypothetical protein WA435_02780 [Gallionellaceae bacterium]